MERTFVTGKAVFRIRQAAGPSEGEMTVTITRDDRLEWTYHQASWRPLAAGWGCGSAYLWSARDLVVLPDNPGEDPSVLTFDEDLLFVFRTAAGWMLACETSVRLITGQDQGARIDLADTVERAWWTGEVLQILDARGTVTAITVTGDRLAVIPDQVPAGQLTAPPPPPARRSPDLAPVTILWVSNWWDGPVEGMASYQGRDCWFQAIFDDEADEWTSPRRCRLYALAGGERLRLWASHRRWEDLAGGNSCYHDHAPSPGLKPGWQDYYPDDPPAQTGAQIGEFTAPPLPPRQPPPRPDPARTGHEEEP